MNNLTPKTKVLLALLLGISIWSLYAYIYQLVHGLGATGMNRPVFWGIYIVNFVFLIGVSAGGIAVASLSNLAGIEKYKSTGIIAELVAIISLILAMICILFDIGRPERLINIILHPQMFSPFVWDFMIVAIYLILCAGLLWTSIKNKSDITKILSYISIPVFVLLHSITAWIFGLTKAQAGWHTAIMAPLFISSALVSGLALVILTILFSRWAHRADIPDSTIIDLGKYFKILLPILFYLLFCEFITIIYSQIPSHISVIKELLNGKFAIFFWFDIFVGIIIPYILINSFYGKTLIGVAIIAFFSLIGVFAERIDIILPSLYHPLLINSTANYFPTWVEFSLVLGLYAFGAILFTIASALIPERK